MSGVPVAADKIDKAQQKRRVEGAIDKKSPKQEAVRGWQSRFRNQGWRQSVRHLGKIWGKPGGSDSLEPVDGRFPAIRSWVGTLGGIKAVPQIFGVSRDTRLSMVSMVFWEGQR